MLYGVQRTVNLIFSGGGDAVSSPAASSSRSPRFSPMGVDDSAQSASYGPGQGRARALGAPKRAYSGNIGGLGLWGFVTFPVRLVMGVLTGTWYFISEYSLSNRLDTRVEEILTRCSPHIHSSVISTSSTPLSTSSISSHGISHQSESRPHCRIRVLHT